MPLQALRRKVSQSQRSARIRSGMGVLRFFGEKEFESPHEVSGQWYDVGGVVEAAVQQGELISIDVLGLQDVLDVAGPCGKLVIGQVDGEGASVQPPPQDNLLLGRDSLGSQLLRSKNGAAGNRFAVAGMGAAGDVSCK